MNKPSAQSRTLTLPKMRMICAANTVTEPGSSGFVLEPSQAKLSSRPRSCPSISETKLPADLELAQQLGESTKRRKPRTFKWAIEQLHRGCLVARHGFACEEWPKRLHYRLEGYGEIMRMVLVCEHAEFECGTFTYADVMARDYYVIDQLELVR